MKKLLSIILVTLMILNITACSDDTNPGDIATGISDDTNPADIATGISDDTNSSDIATGITIENGKMTDGTHFYDGTALVKINDTVCSINKKGEILVKLDYDGYFRDNGYINGLLSVPEGFYNEKGELIKPESVGVDEFYDYGLKDGYILAAVDDSKYNSTSQKLGIMNTSFKWTVQPTEKLYKAFVSSGRLFNTASSGKIYYADGYLYYNKTDMYLECRTGNCFSDFQGTYPEGLKKYGINVYDYDSGKQYDLAVLDVAEKKVLSKVNNCPDNLYKIENFVNSNAFVTLYNSQTNTYHFSLMSKNGKLLFDPIEFPGIRFDTNEYGLYDGQYIMIKDGALIKTYDNTGKQIGQFDASEKLEINKYCRFFYKLSDGVVCVEHEIQTENVSEFYYYNPDFTPLF